MTQNSPATATDISRGVGLTGDRIRRIADLAACAEQVLEESDAGRPGTPEEAAVHQVAAILTAMVLMAETAATTLEEAERALWRLDRGNEDLSDDHAPAAGANGSGSRAAPNGAVEAGAAH